MKQALEDLSIMDDVQGLGLAHSQRCCGTVKTL
jgi:hypothetical protein